MECRGSHCDAAALECHLHARNLLGAEGYAKLLAAIERGEESGGEDFDAAGKSATLLWPTVCCSMSGTLRCSGKGTEGRISDLWCPFDVVYPNREINALFSANLSSQRPYLT